MALCRSFAILIASLSLCAEGTSVTAPLGCFFHGWKFPKELPNTISPVNATSALGCQTICAAITGCNAFGYSPIWHTCYLGSEFANLVRAQEPSFIAGPRTCEVVGDYPSGMKAGSFCAAMPGPNFPGDTVAASNAAWTTSLVPVNMQCWPHNEETGKLERCLGEPISVLEDTATGWPGRCLGLELVTNVALRGQTCEMSCRNNVSCAVWQEIRTVFGELECWQGNGYDCYDKSRGANTVVRSQRLVQGHHRVLFELKGWEVAGLRYAFGTKAFDKVEDATSACRKTCLSTITCQVWTYSTGDGCWFEDTTHSVIDYPPTLSTFLRNTDSSKLVIAGEYIQRLCTQPQDEPTSTSTAVTLPWSHSVVDLPKQVPNPLQDSSSTSSPAQASNQIAYVGPSRFVKVAETGIVYYQDAGTGETNLVKPGCLGWDCATPVKVCLDALSVNQAYIEKMQLGQDFFCEMMTIDKEPAAALPKVFVPSASGPSVASAVPSGDQGPSFWSTLAWILTVAACFLAGAICLAGIVPWLSYGRYHIPGMGWAERWMPSLNGRSFYQKQGSEMADLHSEDQFPLMAPNYPGFISRPELHGPALGFGMGPGPHQAHDFDLVTVTPHGLQVTPLGPGPYPAGVPTYNSAFPSR